MKLNKNTIIILVFVMTALLVSCNLGKQADKGQLTKEKAQTALSDWMSEASGNSGSSGTAAGGSSVMVVEAVQELPQENSAKVNLTFNNWVYGSGKFTYSGSGVATFSRYNDGRWVLRKVQTSDRVWEGNQVKYMGKEITVE